MVLSDRVNITLMILFYKIKGINSFLGGLKTNNYSFEYCLLLKMVCNIYSPKC